MRQGTSPRGYGQTTPEDTDAERPLGMLEAALFFGVLAFIINGLGVVLGRLTNLPLSLLSCLVPALYVAAGFVGARHANIANGVWAGIMAATIDMVGSLLLAFLALPEYREIFSQSSALGSRLPAGFLAILGVVVVGFLVGWVLILGSVCGLIGGAISRIDAFRPRNAYAGDY